MNVMSETAIVAKPAGLVTALLTGSGRAAIATILVSGDGAIECVSRRFTPASGRPLVDFSLGRAVFGQFRMSPQSREDLVVGLVSCNKVEVHCHGGVAA